MRLAIMQPYLFPYIGYFQLIAAVEKFVFYDDVNFIKNGWINRNRILSPDQPHYITVPLHQASSYKKINQIMVHSDDAWCKKIAESIRHCYSKAPHFETINALVLTILFSAQSHIGELAKDSIVRVSEYLGLKAEFVMSSSCYGNDSLHGMERVLDICLKEGATDYYNLPGGRELYSESVFTAHGVTLSFIEPSTRSYTQFGKAFQPNLSIIDVLMFNERDAAREMLLAGVEA